MTTNRQKPPPIFRRTISVIMADDATMLVNALRRGALAKGEWSTSAQWSMRICKWRGLPWVVVRTADKQTLREFAMLMRYRHYGKYIIKVKDAWPWRKVYVR